MASMTKTFHHAAYATISPSAELNDQSGRTVLITGSSSGIGFAIAKAFIEANASQIVITGRNPDSLNRAASELEALSKTTAILVRICNINEENSIKALWERLHSSGVTVDVLVLNAADSDSGPMMPVTKFLPRLRNAFTTNLFANTLMVSRFLDSDFGSNSTIGKPKAIVNISSFMAHSNPAPQQAAYSTSKAAFAHTLQLLADEVPALECQIINVHPGAILTGAVEHAPQSVKDAVVWDQAELPGAFTVWASTSRAAFLHGRFTWSNWDVDELAARKAEFEDPGFLKLGLQGAEYVTVTTHFDKIRELDRA